MLYAITNLIIETCCKITLLNNLEKYSITLLGTRFVPGDY